MRLFAAPGLLWLFPFLLLPLCLFLVFAWKRKQQLISQFVKSTALASLTVGVSVKRQKLRLVLLVVAVAFLIVTLARPQWGFSFEEARQQGLDIVVAIDTSRSMLAADVAPNRLMRARLAALDLMKLAKSDRLGLVAFAGSAFLQCPLTLDEEAFRESVESLDTSTIPQGGTALSEAMQTAMTAFGQGDNFKVLVLFSDGEDHDSAALETAKKLNKEGLRIFTVGVGTTGGELIRVPDEQGNLVFLKDESGNAVKSRLDEGLLREIATVAQGSYLPLQGARPMDVLYAQCLAPLPKTDSTTKLVRERREQFYWPLALSILILISESFLPQRKRIARSEEQRRTTSAALTASMILLCILPSAIASPSSALENYREGNYPAALAEYKKLATQKTNDFRLSYNAGTAAYKAEQFDEAQKFFNRATAAEDLQMQQQAYYNLGNTLFASGERKEEADQKQKAWENSVQNFENALKLNPQDSAAKNNLDFVKQKLEELKQQQQQQKQEQKKDDSSKDQNKDNQDQQNQQKDQKQEQKQQSEKDKESEEKKDPSKQDSKEQDQKKQNESSRQDKQADKGEEKKPSESEAKQGKDKPGETADEAQEAQAMLEGKMTPEEARRFLDAQRQEDRPLIFAPPKKAGARPNSKDW